MVVTLSPSKRFGGLNVTVQTDLNCEMVLLKIEKGGDVRHGCICVPEFHLQQLSGA